MFAQFVLFLLIGVMLLRVYTSMRRPTSWNSCATDGCNRTGSFLYFIVRHLPPGVVGLVLAAIFSAAMSTLSSSLNSSSAAAVNDFYIPATGGRRDGRHYLNVSRLLTAIFGAIQIAVAIVAISLSSRVVDEVLGIASFTNGVILGVFFLGTFTSIGQRGAFAGIAGGTAIMLAIKLLTAVHWQWYILIGSIATFLIGALVAARPAA